jgi:predicted RecB family endonuclease
MTNVEEFIAARISIETLARQITLLVEQNAVQDSRQHLDEANRQLEVLKTMVANEVQVIVASRLTRQLADLGAKVEVKAAKMPAKKKTAKKKPQKTV